jgi:hypothetical protein
MLKQLLLQINDQPVFFEYLNKNGYSKQLIYKYVKNGWLDRVAKGVYKKKGVVLKPLNIVKAIIEQLNIDFHIGAQSALYLQKTSHYLKFNEHYFLFYLDNRSKNSWLASLKYFIFIRDNIFKNNELGLIWSEDKVKISVSERALLEMASLIPKQASIDEFLQIMKLLPNLRANLIQELLVNCLSIKAKRLFLFIAEVCKHKWFYKLDINKIDIGNGARQIVKNGIYIKKYKICVPKEIDYEF